MFSSPKLRRTDDLSPKYDELCNQYVLVRFLTAKFCGCPKIPKRKNHNGINGNSSLNDSELSYPLFCLHLAYSKT